MNKNVNRVNVYAFLWALMVLLFARCTPIDYHYSDYLDNAEKAYPGRVRSIVFMPGNNRAAIESLISTDPRIVRMRISWGEDKFHDVGIAQDEIARYKRILIPQIEEGTYTFDIRTFDNEGNRSMRTEVLGRVYGSNYISGLNNRIINSIERNEERTIINWFPEAADSTLVGTVVTYATADGGSAKVFTEGIENQTALPRAVRGATFTFQTLFKPNSVAIDTFYSAAVEIVPEDYIEPERVLHPRDNWSIAGFSSENTADRHAVANLLDNRPETIWIARFASPPTDYPDHWVTIDMKQELEVDGFMFAQKIGDRKISQLEIQISNDNASWESLGLFVLTDVSHDFQYLDLSERRTCRYFKIVPVAGYDHQRQPGLAEAGTYRFEY